MPADRSTPPLVGADSFDAYYYRNCCGRPYQRDEHWLHFFAGIADRIVADIQPARVMDAGCAMGLLVEALRERGVEAFGIDLSPYAIERVPETMRPFCRCASIAEPFEARVDLVVCIEVVEHMPADQADAAIANFAAHADDVLFSSSPHDHREPTHINVRPPEDWAERFARHGLFRDADYDASFISPWAVRYRRRSEPVHLLVRGFERRLARLEQERADMRAFTAEAQARQAGAEQQLQHVRETLMKEIEQLQRHVAALEGETEPLRRALADAVAEVAAERGRVAAAEETIRNIEQSVFWRIRRLLRRG